jgi:hypothetical protein
MVSTCHDWRGEHVHSVLGRHQSLLTPRGLVCMGVHDHGASVDTGVPVARGFLARSFGKCGALCVHAYNT